MSELTRCNYCDLRDIREDAAKAGMLVTLVERPLRDDFDMGCISYSVFVHGPDEVIDDEKHFVAWMMEISDHCACGE